jgi:hypothetical protein
MATTKPSTLGRSAFLGRAVATGLGVSGSVVSRLPYSDGGLPCNAPLDSASLPKAQMPNRPNFHPESVVD